MRELSMQILLSLLVVLNTLPNFSHAAESILYDPGYVNLSPCPCDLTPTFCDLGCCCDSNCTAVDLALMPCSDGYFGGRSSSSNLRSCNYTDQVYLPDYHVLTCVIIENNAYLGQYFSIPAAITADPDFNTKLATISAQYSFSDDGSRVSSAGGSSTGYQSGNLILANSVGDYLQFPQANSDGICNAQAPMQYMQNVDSSCSAVVTTQTCLSSISSMLTLTSLTLQSSSFSSSSNPLSITPDYYCSVNPALFSKSTTSSTSSSSGFFADVGCSYDNSGVFSCPTASSDNVLETPLTKCNAVTPTVTGSVCQNSLLGAIYSFTWKGPTITGLTVSILLGDVALNSPIVQRFVAKWAYGAAATSAPLTKLYSGGGQGVSITPPPSRQTIQQTTDLTGLISRSGLVGYEYGSPLIGGKFSPSATAFAYMNANYSNQPTIFVPGTDGFCSTAGRARVGFRQDTVSMCNIAFNWTTMGSCTKLRYYMKYRVDEMFPMDSIAVYGNPSLVDSTDWVQVVKSTEINNAALLNSTDVATFVVNGSSTFLSTKFTYCSNVIVGASLEIIVSQQGKARGQAIWQVLGAKVNYTYSNWSLNCRNGDAMQTACGSTTGVAVIQVTLQTLFMQANTTTSIRCWAGVCWEQAIYPWTATYLGEPLTYTRAMGCLILLFTVFILVVSSPFW